MDRWLRSVHHSIDGLRVGRQFPPVNIYELDDEFLLTAEIPGARVEDLELSVAEGVVTLKGVRRAGSDVREEHYRRSERPRGAWQRTVALPARVREEDLHAELNQGVLRLHLPKAASAHARQIRVVEAGSTQSSGGATQ
jgi:HSP20 family protein